MATGDELAVATIAGEGRPMGEKDLYSGGAGWQQWQQTWRCGGQIDG